MLASDINNSEFAGASDPDARCHVTMFRKPLKNEFKTKLEGRPIFEDVDMIKIMIPGDALSIVETPIREDHKRRFPKHWAYFESTQGKENLEVGTPLSQWPLLGPSQVEELRALKFFTVDSIASASDLQISKIGMAGGMSPFALRNKAERFLTVARDSSSVDQAKEELEKFKAEAAEKDAAHAEQLRLMQEQMMALAAAIQRPQVPAQTAVIERKKPGRKPKIKEVVTA